MFSQLKILALLAAALLAAGCSTWCVEQSSLPLPPDGTVVVVAKDAPAAEQDAAKLLQTWLRRACGVTAGFEILSGEQEAGSSAASVFPKGKVIIALGLAAGPPDPRVAALEDDGFLIHREGQIISITGHTSDGTYYGAVAFLDRYAGVRFYLPTEFWTSLPASRAAVFNGGDVLSQPFVDSGDISRFAARDMGDPDWLRRIGGLRRKGGTHQHDLFAIFPPAEFAQTHPEIYPLYDGQRYIPTNAGDQNWQIDFAEPATLAAAEQSLAEYFQKTPDAAYIAVSVNDNTRWSQSERNQAVIAAFQAKDPQGDFHGTATSDIYWRFMNQLAAWLKQKFPTKLLVGLAYGPTVTTPAFPLADNIVVYANLHLSELPWYRDPQSGPPAILDQWLAVAHHFGNHEWYEGDGFLLPRIYSGYWSQFLRELAQHYPSVYMHAEAYPNWGFDGPKYYIMAKMWWDPQADPRALTRQFCDDLFGPAAAPMDQYFAQVEALWMQLDDMDGTKRKLDGWPNQFITTSASRLMIQRCHDFLQQAVAAAQTDDEKKRVALFAQCFAFSESLFKLAAQPGDEALHRQAVALAEDLAKDPWTVYDPNRLTQAIAAIYQDPAKK
jgi:hypothetical protein